MATLPQKEARLAEKPKAKVGKDATEKEEEYLERFLHAPRIPVCSGKTAYIRKSYHERIQRIVQVIGKNGLTLSVYVDRVLEQHFREYEEVIRRLTRKITRTFIDFIHPKKRKQDGIFQFENEKEGEWQPEGGHSPSEQSGKGGRIIHIVDDTQLEKAAVFLRYLTPRQGAHRQCIYLSREMHGKLSRIVRTLGGNGSTIGGYIENVLEEHLQTYGDDINALLRRETSQPL